MKNSLFKNFILLVLGRVVLSELEKGGDYFSARVSASIQVSVLITFNLISIFFLVVAASGADVAVVLSDSRREAFLMAVVICLSASVGLVYFRLAKSDRVIEVYKELESKLTEQKSPLIFWARFYPFLVMGFFGGAVALMAWV